MNFDEHSRLHPERESRKAFPVTTNLEKILLILTAILVVIGIGLTISIVHLQKSNSRILRKFKETSNETCFSPSCISEASNLLKSMDMNIDPCTDFYSFVCGNWIKNNYLVSSLESQFTKLAEIITLRVKEILESLIKKKGLPPNQQKLVNFYKACIDDAHRTVLGAEELISDLKEFGGWPLIEDDWNATDFDWSDLMIQLFRNGYVSNMLFVIKVDVDVKNTSKSLLFINQPTLGLVNRVHYVFPSKTLLNSYKKVIFKLGKLLRDDINEEESMKAIEEAFKIEDKIAHMMKEIDMRNPKAFYNNMTVKELETFAPKIPWRKLFTSLLPPDTSITDDEKILVTSTMYIKGLNDILKEIDDENGQKSLANYMFYRAVFYAAHYLGRQFYGLINELHQSEKFNSLTLWESCEKITLGLFPLPLTANYVSRYTTKETKEVLKMMVEDIKNSLVNDIKNSDWLDAETEKYALYKVEKMKAAIGYPDEILNTDNLDNYYKDINITDNHFGNIKQVIAFRLRNNMKGLHKKRERLRWFEQDNLLNANAYYRPAENCIIIPVGVLQDTVFAAGRPNYINYGSLGMIVGHELTHAFDSLGSLYDAEGNYRMWWSKKSLEKFEEKMKCYEEQYNNYYVQEAKSYVNGTLTLGENVADNGGLKTAYYAYKALLKRTGSEKSLPGFHYNEKQMFWISYASVWCRKQNDESIQQTVKHSVHALSKYRIIGSLSNIAEFSEDFKCKLNTIMNPTSKCSLWK